MPALRPSFARDAAAAKSGPAKNSGSDTTTPGSPTATIQATPQATPRVNGRSNNSKGGGKGRKK